MSVPSSLTIPDRLAADDPAHVFFIGSHPAMQQAAREIMTIARVPSSTVLLLGEEGTGKELASRIIHRLSQCKGALIPVDCPVLTPGNGLQDLFGREGHGAEDLLARRGLIEQASRGTLLFDSIHNLHPDLQQALRRFLDTREFRRPGNTLLQKADVRIIATAPPDIRALVAGGALRADIYHRINAFPILLPPLRERRDDLPALIGIISRELQQRLGLNALPRFSPETIALFQRYHWPGNVRELKQILTGLLLHASDRDVIDIDQVPDSLRLARRPSSEGTLTEKIAAFHLPTSPIDLPALIQQMETTLIEQALQRTKQNQSQAATLLGLTRDQLRQRQQRIARHTTRKVHES